MVLVGFMGCAAAHDDGGVLYNKVAELENGLKEMQGKIQQLEYAHKQLVAKIGNVVDDINYRFAKLETKAGDVVHGSSKGLNEYSQMFSEGKISDALHGLKEYVKHAEEETKGEAYYWLGRAYLAENNYKEAGANFLKSYKYYPINRKAASSLIYLAISLENLDKNNRACSMLERVYNEYPNMNQEEKDLYQKEVIKLKCSSAKLHQ